MLHYKNLLLSLLWLISLEYIDSQIDNWSQNVRLPQTGNLLDDFWKVVYETFAETKARQHVKKGNV